MNLKQVPQSSVDLTITSPPYNVDIRYNSSKYPFFNLSPLFFI